MYIPEVETIKFSLTDVLWPLTLCLLPLDFQIQKRIVSSETIWGNTVTWLLLGAQIVKNESEMYKYIDIW